MGDRLSEDEKVASRVNCSRSSFQRDQRRVRGRHHGRYVKQETPVCPNERCPKPEPNPAVLPQKIPRLTISPNLLQVRGIDRDLRSRFNRNQRHRYVRAEYAPDGFRILKDICVVNLDRIPESKQSEDCSVRPTRKMT